jgi:hypothetical protein
MSVICLENIVKRRSKMKFIVSKHVYRIFNVDKIVSIRIKTKTEDSDYYAIVAHIQDQDSDTEALIGKYDTEDDAINAMEKILMVLDSNIKHVCNLNTNMEF